MTGILVRAQEATQSYSCNEVFSCPEESQFYSHCLERLVLHHCAPTEAIVEFGCGDGSPVIHALLRSSFHSTIHGYDLNASACQAAASRIQQHQLHRNYLIYNQSFFDSQRPQAHYLIANPPYLPAPDDDICMPLLHGGVDGATITNRLLALNYPKVMVLIASYSNPVGTIRYGLAKGYQVADFMMTPLRFGYYSSEPKVRNHIHQLRHQRQAFYSENIYFLAGVLFSKQPGKTVDLSQELIRIMTAL